MFFLKKIRERWHSDIKLQNELLHRQYDELRVEFEKTKEYIVNCSYMQQQYEQLHKKHDELREQQAQSIDEIKRTEELVNNLNNKLMDAVAKIEHCELATNAKVEYESERAEAELQVIKAKMECSDILVSDTKSSMDISIAMLRDALAHLQLLRSNEEGIVENCNSIFSYCQNQFWEENSSLKETGVYQYYKRIHELTSINIICEKDIEERRVGRDHDGGYVMVLPASRECIAYSLGICDDVSWDQEMADMGYDVFQYDHTIDALPMENERFHWEKIGLTGEEETEELKHLETLIKKNGHEGVQGMVLKMDIEGYEWSLLKNCPEYVLNQFDQIVLEMHGLTNVDDSELILGGLENLTQNHSVIHAHGNNYRQVAFCGEYMTPDVVEMTLVKNDLFSFKKVKTCMLGKLDQINRTGYQDIWLAKW